MRALLLGMLLLLFSFCTYADTLNVVIPYDQLWLTDSARADGTFHYTFAPTDGSPVPSEAGNDGIYRFALTGNVQGELTLTIPFDRQGYYTYRSEGTASETTAEVKEVNDTYDIYKATQKSIEKGTSTADAEKNLDSNPMYTDLATSIYTVTAIDNNSNKHNTNVITAGDVALTIKNEIAIVSPTGVALRFAPYAVILAAGLALLFVSRRRRADDEE